MLEVEWKYFKENIGSDNQPVAILHRKGSPDSVILSVYQSLISHVSVPSPDFSFIRPKNVPYRSELYFISQKYEQEKFAFLSTSDILFLRLKEGCNIIENDFLEQATKMIKLLS